MTKQEPKNPVGRPSKMTPEVIAKLQEAFLNSATDEEACLVAGISPSALYEYQEKHPEFLEEKNLLKQDTNYKSRMNIVKAIREGNLQQSNWWAERKVKDEFSGRTELTGKDGGQLFDLTGVLNELDNEKQSGVSEEVEKESDSVHISSLGIDSAED